MGIFNDNPILSREVRGRLRLKRKGGVRANRWIAGLLGAIVGYYYLRGLAAIWNGTSQDARDFWPLLTNGALILIVLLSPALAATAVTQEREQQTWEAVVITRLTASEVLLGKWLGRQLIPWLLLALLLPLLAVTSLRADFRLLMLPVTLAFLLVTTACYSALGLLCSFLARRTMTATAAALMVSALLCVGTVIVNAVLSYFAAPNGYSGQRPDSLVMWLNPFKVLTAIFESFTTFAGNVSTVNAGDGEPNGSIVLAYFVVSLVVTAAALRLMIGRYGRLA